MTRRVRKRRVRGTRGALVLVAGLLIASALLRMGEDAGRVWARGTESAEIPADAAKTPECSTDDDLRAMLTRFQTREADIQAREGAMAERGQALKLAGRRIEEKLARLQSAEEELRQTLALADTAAQDDIDRLTKVYENMKPKQAAALFEEMNPEFAAGFLGRMRPEAAAGIMAGLSPQAAHTFSVVMAGRNAGVPTE